MPLLQFTHVDSFFNWKGGRLLCPTSILISDHSVWKCVIWKHPTYLNRFDQRNNPEWETAADESKQSQSQKVPRRRRSLTSFSSSPTTVTDVDHVLSRGLERRNVNSFYYPIGKWLHVWRYTHLGLAGKWKATLFPILYSLVCAHSTILLFHLRVLLWTQTE